jgi:hypothetical protein
MTKFRFFTALIAIVVLAAFALPVFAQEYSPGVTMGQYVKYGNFVGVGPGFESFNDYNWLKLDVVSVSGKEVTLLSTGQFKDGSPIPGNGSTTVWNVEAGTEDGSLSTQGSIIAANLTEGDAIPPPNTYTINKTASRTYLGVSRSVNILDVTVSTPDYDSALTYVYDKISGMLLESTSTTATTQPESSTSEYSYSIIETNIFCSTSMTNLPVVVIIAIAFIVVVGLALVIVLLLKRN